MGSVCRWGGEAAPQYHGVMRGLPDELRVAVSIEGTWVNHPTRGYRDWHGVASCEEPLVGMSLMTVGGAVEWAKASDTDVQLRVRFLLSPWDNQRPEVQVAFAVGDSGVRHWQIPAISREERPSIAPVRAETGQVVRLAE